MANPNGWWTPERCVEDARQYATKSEWAKNSASAYQKARRVGWLEECTAHMPRYSRKNRPNNGRKAIVNHRTPVKISCNQCEVEQHFTRFHRHPHNITGRMGHCKRCHETRSRERLRVPPWASRRDITLVYRSRDMLKAITGRQDLVVDHVIPCKGKLVSGLHVASNLRIITHSQNQVKKNKFKI